MSLSFLIFQVTMERCISWLLCHFSPIFIGVPDFICNVYFLFLSFPLVCEVAAEVFISLLSFPFFFSWLSGFLRVQSVYQLIRGSIGKSLPYMKGLCVSLTSFREPNASFLLWFAFCVC